MTEWRIVRLEDDINNGLTGPQRWYVRAEAPPEVVPAVWSHAGCATCGGSGTRVAAKAEIQARCGVIHQVSCPDGYLVPWGGEA